MKTLKIYRLVFLTLLYLSGIITGIALFLVAVDRDQQVRNSVYADAIRYGVAREDTNGNVFWVFNDEKEYPVLDYSR